MNILFLVKLPPPITGATIINQYITQIQFNNFNLKVIKLNYKNNLKRDSIFTAFLKITQYSFKVLTTVLKFKPNFVYFQISPIGFAFLRDCIYVFIIKSFKIKIIFHLHGKGILEESKNRFKNILYKWAFKNNIVICLSEKLLYDVKNVHFGGIYIVNNGIPVYNNISSKERSVDKLNVLFLSHLQKSKGLLIFIDAISLLLKIEKYKNLINVKIIGSELDLSRDFLNKETIRLKISENVKILGPKYGNEKLNHLLETDILVYPTLNDTWGLVILEAMQLGIPVIASKEGAIPEIVDDGVTGFLVDKNNPEQIKDKLITLIENETLRKEMGDAARKKFFEKYTLELFEKKMLDTFDKIIASYES